MSYVTGPSNDIYDAHKFIDGRNYQRRHHMKRTWNRGNGIETFHLIERWVQYNPKIRYERHSSWHNFPDEGVGWKSFYSRKDFDDVPGVDKLPYNTQLHDRKLKGTNRKRDPYQNSNISSRHFRRIQTKEDIKHSLEYF
jgi:hypothetical protein